ncbi:hypothetical protein PIROE2DRAFT_12127 [Piromyces sp. E2]|nr:hypothetical protein PIROE2DRAFT_12127 [Piromyces sp. E2]|eukprot:OUM61773.1 hypothetical protein PIROE2DRAFT_12127 [Piromyces sp. E2]
MMNSLTKSYIYSNIDKNIKEITFSERFLQLCREKDEQSMFSFYETNNFPESITFTFRDTLEITNRIGTGLYTTIGLKKGDVVGIYLPSSLPYVLIQAAIESCGLILFQLNPGYTSDQIHRFIHKGKPTLIVTSSKLFKNIPEHDLDIKVLLVDAPFSDIKNSIYSFDEIKTTRVNADLLFQIRNQIKPSDIMYYGCTSGSTGDPKICTYTNKQFVGNVMEVNGEDISQLPYKNITLLSFVPFFTTTGHTTLGTMFLQGFRHVLTDSFNPERIFQIIEKEKINIVPGSPAAFLALMHHPSRKKYDLSSLREFFVAGAAISNGQLEVLQNTFELDYAMSAFGMTEGCGIIYKMPTRSSGFPPGPVNHFEVRIVDRESREIVDIGFPGELEYRSPIMMNGYLNNEEANYQAFTQDKWFKTGDEAVMEANGYIKITGRIKDMIIRGGHNIWPNEIMDILNRHPKIQESAVIGIPDKFHGESVVAFVLVKPGCTFNNLEGELCEFLKNKLIPFSLPTYYFQLQEFPRNSSLKVYTPTLKVMVKDLIQERFNRIAHNNHDPPKTQQGRKLAELWSTWFDVPENIFSRSTNFFKMGGDSLVGVQTIAFVKQYFKEVPYNFLNDHQTLGEIEDFLQNPNLDSKITTEIFGDINTFQNNNKKSVAITGVSGYLGIFIARELCQRNDIEKIYCIGRSSSMSELKVKIASMMKKIYFFDEKKNKLELVIGDITQNNCGIEPKKLEEIKKKCHTLIHCAAVVNWTKTYEQLKESNVTGVLNTMKIAGISMDYVYISSFGAALNRNETLSDTLPKNLFGYIQSKWLAEHYVIKGRDLGIQSTIIRPCYIVADSKTGVCNTNDFIYKFIYQCFSNKIVPKDIFFNLTPVDKVAKGIVDFMHSHKIINLIPSKSLSTNELFHLFNEKYHQSVVILSKEEWIKKFKEIAQHDLYALSIIPYLIVIFNQYTFTSDFLKGKNDFLNFEPTEMIINFDKLYESGFFDKNSCRNLFERSKY